jgi:hypothetical protein
MDRDYKLSLIAFALFREKQNKPFNFSRNSRKTRNLNTIASKITVVDLKSHSTSGHTHQLLSLVFTLSQFFICQNTFPVVR